MNILSVVNKSAVLNNLQLHDALFDTLRRHRRTFNKAMLSSPLICSNGHTFLKCQVRKELESIKLSSRTFSRSEVPSRSNGTYLRC